MSRPSLPLFRSTWLVLLLVGSANAAVITGSTCKRIVTGPGPADLVAQPGPDGKVFISSHDRRHFQQGGEIQLLDPQTNEVRTLRREGEPPEFVLRPHGIDLVQRNGQWLLYVISHDRDLFSDNHRLVIYRYEDGVLRHQESLESPLMTAPNGVAVASNGDVYITNERAQGSSMVELILLERRATVVMHRPGKGWQTVANQLAFANGIAVSGDQVWVSQTLGDSLRRYRRKADGTLTGAESLPHRLILGNLQLTPDRRLLAAAYPSLLDLGLHWQLRQRKAPSQIYKLDPDNGHAELIFEDGGKAISGASTALQHGNTLYVGQLFDSHLLRCDLPPSQGIMPAVKQP